MGVFTWLRSRIFALKDPEKTGLERSYSRVVSLCPNCGAASWAHYSDELIAEVEADPSALTARIGKYESSIETLVTVGRLE